MLRNYKNSRNAAVRRQFTDEPAGVLATFLARHRRCLGQFIALRRAGAVRVTGLVIGRRVDTRAPGTFDWSTCVLCRQG